MKKFLALILVAVLALGLVACTTPGGTSPDEGDKVKVGVSMPT